jgi:hypothetical protein
MSQQKHLRRYVSWAVKAILCAACWVGICALLVMHGPPVMRVASVPTSAVEGVATVVGILLSGGAATILTIVLDIFVLASIGWNRDRGAGDEDQISPTDALEEGS